ncbi:MAG: hypothetical protein WDO69_27065 [Pseudomonadota bacterium]
MVLPQSSMNRFSRVRPESADPFAMQLALSRVHARLVPMQRGEQGYTLDPSAEGWCELPADRGFAGYGLGRALRMLLDVLRGLTALHDTFDAEGVNFAHGEVTLTQFRVDHDGVCRLVPLTGRHSSASVATPPADALGHLAPERLLGEPVDPRADVFSGGVLLWEALAGRRLFSETTADAIVDRLMGEKLQMPQLPPELAWAIPLKSIAARALSVDPYQRFADCAELATAIAIVARERVATHAEIAAFFGSKLRSLNSVAQQRPIPTRSSTFPSVSLPVSPAPPSVSAPASSRNGFPLATPGPRAVTPGPMPAARVPESQRNVTHKSPFATLLGVGENVPASHRRKTLTSVGTPLSALDPTEAAPESASAPSSSSKLPPPFPGWAASVSTDLAPPSQAPTSSSAVVARATLESVSLSAEEVATFRRWSTRRSLIAVGLLAVAGIVIAMIALGSSGEAPDTAKNRLPTQAAALRAIAPATATPQPAAISEDHARPAPAPPSAAGPSNGAPAANPKELHPASKAASPTKPASGPKDYGI